MALEHGCRVRLQGLNTTALNGSEGIIAGPFDNGRFPVRLLSPAALVEAYPDGLRVKPPNLENLSTPNAMASSLASIYNQSATVFSGVPSAEEARELAPNALDARLRTGVAVETVRRFLAALDADMYPDESFEKVFGVEMGSAQAPTGAPLSRWPVGKVVFGAWQSVYKNFMNEAVPPWEYEPGLKGEERLKAAKTQFSDQLVRALLDGRLPAWYEAAVRAVQPATGYTHELVRRRFAGISYDKVLHDRMSGAS